MNGKTSLNDVKIVAVAASIPSLAACAICAMLTHTDGAILTAVVGAIAAVASYALGYKVAETKVIP